MRGSVRANGRVEDRSGRGALSPLCSQAGTPRNSVLLNDGGKGREVGLVPETNGQTPVLINPRPRIYASRRSSKCGIWELGPYR